MPMGCTMAYAAFKTLSTFLNRVAKERTCSSGITHYSDDFHVEGPIMQSVLGIPNQSNRMIKGDNSFCGLAATTSGISLTDFRLLESVAMRGPPKGMGKPLVKPSKMYCPASLKRLQHAGLSPSFLKQGKDINIIPIQNAILQLLWQAQSLSGQLLLLLMSRLLQALLASWAMTAELQQLGLNTMSCMMVALYLLRTVRKHNG
ncbi:UNVERIFIED_CONTAM: hypothetical protein K2H54_055027 [Gekko kuhli]